MAVAQVKIFDTMFSLLNDQIGLWGHYLPMRTQSTNRRVKSRVFGF